MDQLEQIKKIVKDFDAKQRPHLGEILALSKKLRSASNKIESTWSGSFAGWHGRMYFKNFKIPSIYEKFSGEWGGINGIPDGWEEKQPEEVKLKIEELVGNNFSADKFEDDTEQIIKDAENVRNEISIIFTSPNFKNITEKEVELIEKIEKHTFGKHKGKYIRDRLPTTMMSRDMEALRQGTLVASWLYYECVALASQSTCEAVNEFIIFVDRIIKQLELKTNSSLLTPPPSPIDSVHTEIYNKCHELYEQGSYAESVEKSFKVVRDRLRKITGHETGSEAFGKSKLHIKGASASHVDQDFNEAVKFLTMAIDRFRNEKSHTSDAKIDDPIRAYEYLRLSSLAMNLLDDSEILS
jgi:uncharacterized protein (TIGR02391 family)